MLKQIKVTEQIFLLIVLAAFTLAVVACQEGSAANTGTQGLEPQADTAAVPNNDQDEPGDPENGDDADNSSENEGVFDDNGLPQYGDFPAVSMTADDFTDVREAVAIYSLSIQPELFVNCVDNAYYPLIPGTVYHLEEQTDEGLETITITVTNQTREVMGIPATVVRDTARLDGAIIEDTWDWYAQDDRGNVWYLGEDTQEYEDGEIVSTAGSWEAGVDGALPGIMMLGQPRPGDRYYQEYWQDEAEDMGAIISLSESADVPYGSFNNAIQTADYNPLDDNLENKWYAPGVGVVQESVGDEVSAELVSVSHDSSQIVPDSSCGNGGGVSFVGTITAHNSEQDLEQLAQITADQATEAASGADNAQLTVLKGFLVYVVTLDNEEVAIVDAGDGVVLATMTHK